MKAREVVYFILSSIIGYFVHRPLVIRWLSIFTFHVEGSLPHDTNIRRWLRTPGIPIGASVFFLLFIVNGIWSWFNGRFFIDDNPDTRNFLEDWPNLINYTVLCPLYTTLGLWFIVHISHLRSNLKETGLHQALGLTGFEESGKLWKYVICAGTILLSSVLSISFFASELPQYRYSFWFQGLSTTGDKVLTAHGFYYLITNMMLNLVVVVVIALHLEMLAVACYVGKALQGKLSNEHSLSAPLMDTEGIIKMFSPFTDLYLVSKVLVVIFIANMYTWRAQELDFTGILDVSIILVALLGVAVVSYPRYHAQSWLYRAWRTNGILGYPETRNPLVVGLASVADLLILGSATTNLIAYVLDKSGVQLQLF